MGVMRHTSFSVRYRSHGDLQSHHIAELEKIQGAVARFILQLPSSASKVSASMDAGMKPIDLRLKARQLMFVHTVTSPKKEKLVRMVIETVLTDKTDPWTAQVQEEINNLPVRDFFSADRKQIKEIIKQYQINQVHIMKGGYSSQVWMCEPIKWFTLQPHMNDSQESRTLNRFRSADVGLGNRRPKPIYRLPPL